MDEADITDRHSEFIAKANLDQSYKSGPKGVANGHCWFCGEDVEPGRRWCSKQCCDEWQSENPIKRTP